jgi:hypothetical protein
MSGRTDPMLARLRPLPLRLRIAHLVALLRCGRLIVREGCLAYPSSREASTTSASINDGRAG